MYLLFAVPLPVALLVLWWCWCRRLQLEGRPLRPRRRVHRRLSWAALWDLAQGYGLPGVCAGKSEDPEEGLSGSSSG